MTRQEKVNLLNELLEIEEKNDIGNLTSTDRREFQQWVEELEQEPKTDVLDKIKSEIAEYKDDKIIHNERNEMIDIVLEIIDKYMRGTEDE